jgi:hypothetical protein
MLGANCLFCHRKFSTAGSNATGLCPTSETQFFRRVSQLLVAALRVPGRRVQILVSQDLRQRHEIVAVVGQKLVGKRMPQQVRVQRDARDG